MACHLAPPKTPPVDRLRRMAPDLSLPFMIQDLQEGGPMDRDTANAIAYLAITALVEIEGGPVELIRARQILRRRLFPARQDRPLRPAKSHLRVLQGGESEASSRR